MHRITSYREPTPVNQEHLDLMKLVDSIHMESLSMQMAAGFVTLAVVMDIHSRKRLSRWTSNALE